MIDNGTMTQDVWGWVAENSAQGAGATGEISDFLLRAGMTVEAVRNMLNTIAVNAAGTPEQVDYVSDELRYLNTGRGNSRQTNWAPILIGAGLLYLVLRNNNGR